MKYKCQYCLYYAKNPNENGFDICDSEEPCINYNKFEALCCSCKLYCSKYCDKSVNEYTKACKNFEPKERK